MTTRKTSSKASKRNARGKTKGATKKGAAKKGATKRAAVGVKSVQGYPLTSRLEVLVDENPRNAGSAAHKRFETYKSCKTIGDYAKKWPVKARQDIVWDLERKFIKVTKA